VKLTVQAPYAIGAIIAWFVIGGVVNLVTSNPQTGFLVASIAAFVIWMIGHDKAEKNECGLEDPPAMLFAASDFEVLAAIKEAMQNNIGDKWWVQKSFDDTTDEEGNMKAKYTMTYDEELKTQPPKLLKSQLVLDIRVAKVAAQTSVKLNYQVASDQIRWTANEILETTTAMIGSRLERLAAIKSAKSAGDSANS